MQDLETIQALLLDAREKRYSLRKSIAQERYSSLSLSLNIPAYPKSNASIHHFFSIVLAQFKDFLQANNIEILSSLSTEIIDEDGDFFVAAIKENSKYSPSALKKITEDFEANHLLGRLIDVDIFDKNTLPISSGKAKKCFYCNEHSAVSCMRAKRHSYSQMRTFIEEKIALYTEQQDKEKNIKKLCQWATKSIFYELALNNKPGLVGFDHSGNHSDMNYISFINSTAAINPYFADFCELAYRFEGDYTKVLPQIRAIGLQCERDMFAATKGVNTHKGIIFIFGISLFATSLLFRKNKEFNSDGFRKIVKQITKGITEKELIKTNKNSTHGEKIFAKYGSIGGGIRQEAESGFETVFNTALPYFSENLKGEYCCKADKFNSILQNGLLLIMSKNNDSNILYRSDIETLEALKQLSSRVLSKETSYDNLIEFCTKKEISPGGSADLLALSLFLHFTKTEAI